MATWPPEIGVDDQDTNTELGKDNRGIDQGGSLTVAAPGARHKYRMRRAARLRQQQRRTKRAVGFPDDRERIVVEENLTGCKLTSCFSRCNRQRRFCGLPQPRNKAVATATC